MACADGGLDAGLVERLVGEVGLHQLVVELGDRLDQDGARLVGCVDQVLGDVDDLDLLAEVVLVNRCLLGDEVDDAGELGLRADRQLNRDRVGAEALDHRADAHLEAGAGAVHLVDVGDARHLVGVGLAPDGLGLRLDAGDRVEDGYCAVEHAQRTLDLDGEVDVARRVNDVDAVVVPESSRRSGGDRDSALLLLLHPVHRGCALVNFTDLVRAAGVVQDALSRRRLTGVDVGHDPDVSGLF